MITQTKLPKVGQRVGVVYGPGEFPHDNSGIVIAIIENQWGKHALVMMDSGTVEHCDYLVTVGIGWHLVEGK